MADVMTTWPIVECSVCSKAAIIRLALSVSLGATYVIQCDCRCKGRELRLRRDDAGEVVRAVAAITAGEGAADVDGA